jgi:hypothetical protein
MTDDVNTQQQAWCYWLSEGNWDVFGKLNFAPNRKFGDDDGQRHWARFWNKVDKLVFGNCGCDRFGHRIDRMVFTQFGVFGDNPHIHFLARTPTGVDVADFCQCLNAIWADMCPETAPPSCNEILPIIRADKAAGYVLHDFRTLGSATFNHRLSHQNTIGTTPHSQAASRLHGKARGIWLIQAKFAYENHRQLAQARFDRRNV